MFTKTVLIIGLCIATLRVGYLGGELCKEVFAKEVTNIQVEQIDHRGKWNDSYKNREDKKSLALMRNGNAYCSFVPDSVDIIYKVMLNEDKSDTILVLQFTTQASQNHFRVDTLGGKFVDEFQTLYIDGSVLHKDNHMGPNIIKDFRENGNKNF